MVRKTDLEQLCAMTMTTVSGATHKFKTTPTMTTVQICASHVTKLLRHTHTHTARATPAQQLATTTMTTPAMI